jgi:hypothetical protein
MLTHVPSRVVLDVLNCLSIVSEVWCFVSGGNASQLTSFDVIYARVHSPSSSA